MEKHKQDSGEELQTWNSAKPFTEVKIMRLIADSDTLEAQAEFGFESLEKLRENKDIKPLELIKRKVEAFEFLVFKLIQLMRNSSFAIQRGEKEFQKIYKKLTIVEEILPDLKTYSRNRTWFDREYPPVLKIVKDLKRDLNVPLNMNNLIFTTKKEYNPKEAKRRLLAEAKGEV